MDEVAEADTPVSDTLSADESLVDVLAGVLVDMAKLISEIQNLKN